MVLSSSASVLIFLLRPFFCGRKPSKQNLSDGKPELTRAGINADGPGRVSTEILSLIHSLTRRKPGSEIEGVPASVTRAKVSPFFILFEICLTVLCSLNL